MTLPPLTGKRNAKAIEQLDMEGKVIAVWESAREAHEALNINAGYITNCLKGRRREAGGFKWRYK